MTAGSTEEYLLPLLCGSRPYLIDESVNVEFGGRKGLLILEGEHEHDSVNALHNSGVLQDINTHGIWM